MPLDLDKKRTSDTQKKAYTKTIEPRMAYTQTIEPIKRVPIIQNEPAIKSPFNPNDLKTPAFKKYINR